MKTRILILGAIATTLVACSPAEPVVPAGELKQAAIATKRIVVKAGYRCDSISFYARSSYNGTLHLSCNDNQYSYDVRDVGGQYVVEVLQ